MKIDLSIYISDEVLDYYTDFIRNITINVQWNIILTVSNLSTILKSFRILKSFILIWHDK